MSQCCCSNYSDLSYYDIIPYKSQHFSALHCWDLLCPFAHRHSLIFRWILGCISFQKHLWCWQFAVELALNSILLCLGYSQHRHNYLFFLDCSCPKGNPLAVPPIYAQECDLEGSCYCAGDLTLSETGCLRGGKYDYILGKLLTE